MKYPEVEYETDKDMSIDQLWSFLRRLQRKHGLKARVRVGENKLFITPTKMTTVRCPACKSLAGVRIDGTLSNHNYRTSRAHWERCGYSGRLLSEIKPHQSSEAQVT